MIWLLAHPNPLFLFRQYKLDRRHTGKLRKERHVDGRREGGG
jgi:hypothetical protein